MNTTISTHNGSSFSLGHNRRDPKYTSKVKHIDLERKHENWVDVPIREAYSRLFGESMMEYNEKQTREDRKIVDYYRKIQADSRKHVAYEMIISVGSKENPIPDVIGYDIMREYVQNWKERNQNLYLYGAYYHADEDGVPHVHCDYIPVARGFKRGMKTQTALTKALEQQGFEHKGNKATCQIQWEKSENQYLEGLCEGYGIEIDHPMAGKGVEHIHYTTYKAKKELEEVQRELDRVRNSLMHGEREVEKAEKRLFDVSEELRMNEICLSDTEDKIQNNIDKIGSSRKEIKKLQEKEKEISEHVQDLEELQELSAAMISNPKQIKKVPLRDSVIVEGATREQVQDAFDIVATIQGILNRQRKENEELEERERMLDVYEKSLQERETRIRQREREYEKSVESAILKATAEQEKRLIKKFKKALNNKILEIKEQANKAIDNVKRQLDNSNEMNQFLKDTLYDHGISWSAYDYVAWCNEQEEEQEKEYKRKERGYDDFER